MPAYLVQLDATRGGYYLKGGHSAMVVFAGSVADARAVAKGAKDGGSAGPWDDATVTEVVAATDLSDAAFALKVQVQGTTPPLDITANGGVSGVATVVIVAGGTGYSVNDILTLDVGSGTASRQATFRVTSESGNVIDGIELVDPGEYSVDTGLSAQGVTGGGGGDDATFDITYTTDGMGNFMAEMVGLLNATADIAAAAIDMGAATPLLTVAAISDNIGDSAIVVEMRMGQDAVPGLIGTIVDEGIAGAVLTAEFPAAPVLPSLVAQLSD